MQNKQEHVSFKTLLVTNNLMLFKDADACFQRGNPQVGAAKRRSPPHPSAIIITHGSPILGLS
jgi:hypothetical protein